MEAPDNGLRVQVNKIFRESPEGLSCELVPVFILLVIYFPLDVSVSEDGSQADIILETGN